MKANEAKQRISRSILLLLCARFIGAMIHRERGEKFERVAHVARSVYAAE